MNKPTYEKTGKYCKVHKNIELIETGFPDGDDYGYYCRKCRTCKLYWNRTKR